MVILQSKERIALCYRNIMAPFMKPALCTIRIYDGTDPSVNGSVCTLHSHPLRPPLHAQSQSSFTIAHRSFFKNSP